MEWNVMIDGQPREKGYTAEAEENFLVLDEIMDLLDDVANRLEDYEGDSYWAIESLITDMRNAVETARAEDYQPV